MSDAHHFSTYPALELAASVNSNHIWHFFRGIEVNYQSQGVLPETGATCYDITDIIIDA
jgi:hypothetical protein